MEHQLDRSHNITVVKSVLKMSRVSTTLGPDLLYFEGTKF